MDQATMVSAQLAPSKTERPHVVEVRGVEKRYKKTVALRDVSLSVKHSEIFGLIGPDGSGKSSLIRAVAGVQQYYAGSIVVFDQLIDSERSAEKVKDRIGLMPQGLGNNLYAELSVEENIDYFAGLRLVPRDTLCRRKDRLLSMTRLYEFRDRPMKQLSGGMKQKLGLICTLIHAPDLILLDEPTTGVDPVSRRDFWAILTELVHELSMTVVVSTAYMDEAAYMDRLALFMDGKIISQGQEEDIKSLVSGTVVTFRPAGILATTDRVKVELPHVQTMGEAIRVFVPEQSFDAALESVSRVASVPVDELTASVPEMEDVLAFLLAEDSSPNASKLVRPSGQELSLPARHPLSSSAPIQARELVQDFGEFRAVDHVSFEVPNGHIFGLLGSNGAGKTTVIKMLTGLLPPTSGAGSVAGADMHHASQQIKQRIGYMSQSFSLYVDMTAMENLEFYAGVYGLFPRQSRQRIPEVLQMIGLAGYEARITADLPIGMRQRLALGCALIHRPSVIFLDEPTSGVDVLGRRQFWDILIRLAKEDGVAILVTTHYMTEAEHCDSLALMFAGRVVASGTPRQLRNKLQQEVGTPLGLVTSSPLQALRAAQKNGFDRAALFGRSLRILTQHATRDESLLQELLAGNQIEVIATQHESVTMEDVFVHSICTEEENMS